MTVTVGLFLGILALAFICEFIDASLGMGYGTILTPCLLLVGFEPLLVVPAILISQAFGGLSASVFHHQFENVTFNRNSRDLKIVIVITGFGLLATILAAIIAINLPKIVVKSYIGILVTVMGVIVLWNKPFHFSWKKIAGIGVLSAFNKGISGGGFGPVVTAGQILSGQDHKAAIGATTLAEAPICIAGFLAYLIGRTITEVPAPVLNAPFRDFAALMFSEQMFQWELILALLLGSVMVGPFAAFTTRALSREKIHVILGILIIVLGVWTLYETWK